MTNDAGSMVITMADIDEALLQGPKPGKGRAARRLTRRLKRIRKQLRAAGGTIRLGLGGVFVEGCTLQGIALPKVDGHPCGLRITECDATERGPTRQDR